MSAGAGSVGGPGVAGISEARRSALWFALPERGVIEVSGSDRIGWLNGMVSNALPKGDGCCHAALLTPKGRIVADLYVVKAGEQLWLELERAALPGIVAHLERHVIADDVALADRSDELLRIAVEGPAARELVGRIAQLPSAEIAASVGQAQIGGAAVTFAAYGFSGESALQLFAPSEARTGIEAALAGAGVARGDGGELEILRIEAGIPRLGRELDEDVLPDEARLDDAISTSKGCYTGQEIVARLRSRGQVQHLLVGLRLPEAAADLVRALDSGSEGAAEAAGEFAIEVEGKRSGEVTSAGLSPALGPIALGFVRREHAESGRLVEIVGVGRRAAAEVVLLPFPVFSSRSSSPAQ